MTASPSPLLDRPDTPWRFAARPRIPSLNARLLDYFGGRTISFFGSFILAYNQLVGPGLLELPRVFKNAGWLPTTAALAGTCLVSSLAVTLLCDVMARIPGSGSEDRRRSRVGGDLERWMERAKSSLSSRPPSSAASRAAEATGVSVPESASAASLDEDDDPEVSFYTPPLLVNESPAVSPGSSGLLLPISAAEAVAAKVEPSQSPLPHQVRRYEFCDLFGFLFGSTAFKLALVPFVLCNVAQAVSAIVATAQVTDHLLVYVTGRTYALNTSPLGFIGWGADDCHRANGHPRCRAHDVACARWAKNACRSASSLPARRTMARSRRPSSRWATCSPPPRSHRSARCR